MKLTTKGRYAVTAMLDLSIHGVKGPIALPDISLRQDISLPYLEQLMARLRKVGLVTSVRGPGGGYQVSREPHTITIFEILEGINEKIKEIRCVDAGHCEEGKDCLTHLLWDKFYDAVEDFLLSITLGDMMTWPEVRTILDKQTMTWLDRRPLSRIKVNETEQATQFAVKEETEAVA